jgi:hypothetical protein
MLGTLRWRHHVRGDEDEIRGRPAADADTVEPPPSPEPVAADRERI